MGNNNKIAILTWFHYQNFGTALQAAALKNVLESAGYCVAHINYTPDGRVLALHGSTSGWYSNKLHNLFKAVLHKTLIDSEKTKRYKQFIHDTLKLTQPCIIGADFEYLNDKYGAFICGSDQIWAPTCFDSKYFLDFVHDTRRMVAYAPSIGLSSIDDKYVKKRMAELIGRFDHLSVREQRGAELIRELCGKKAEVVLDPTMLLNAEDWNRLVPAVCDKPKSKPYVLCYFLGANEKHWHRVKQISDELGISVKVLPIFVKDLKRGYDIALGAGPVEFLDLVRNAAFICTDSFHGTVFSLLFHKPFQVFERFTHDDPRSQNSRVYNLLNMTGIQWVLEDNQKICDRVYDWNDIEQRIGVARKHSIDYLLNALHQAASVQNSNEIYPLTKYCCGCGACAAVCPNGAIKLTENDDGFLAPVFDENKCVKCEKCRRVCPMLTGMEQKLLAAEQKLYSFKAADTAVLKRSSSGGFAHELSHLYFKNGVDVVGCSYNVNTERAEHKIVRNGGDVNELKIFQGSKYIQSNFSAAFDAVLNDSGDALIFGTPCQIAAFDNVARMYGKRDKFTLVDLICHGVPTRNLLLKYFSYLEGVYKIKRPHQIIFRDKSKGWREIYIYNGDLSKSISLHQNKDLFFRFFENGHCYSKSCYECPFRSTSSADLRIGDYWGPRFKKDKTGVSMALVLTDKGYNVIDALKNADRGQLREESLSDYSSCQQMVNFKRPVFYEELMEALRDSSVSLDTIAHKYCDPFDKIRRINKTLYPIYKKAKEIYKKHIRKG